MQVEQLVESLNFKPQFGAELADVLMKLAIDRAQLADYILDSLAGKIPIGEDVVAEPTEHEMFIYIIFIAFLEFAYAADLYEKEDDGSKVPELTDEEKQFQVSYAGQKIGVALCWMLLREKENAHIYLRELDFNGKVAKLGIQTIGEFSEMFEILDLALEHIILQWKYLKDNFSDVATEDLDDMVGCFVAASIDQISSRPSTDYPHIFKMHALASVLMVWIKHNHTQKTQLG